MDRIIISCRTPPTPSARRAAQDAKARVQRIRRVLRAEEPPARRAVAIAERLEGFALEEIDRARDLAARVAGVATGDDGELASAALIVREDD